MTALNEREQEIVARIAIHALGDAEVFDTLVKELGLSDEGMRELREKLYKAKESFFHFEEPKFKTCAECGCPLRLCTECSRETGEDIFHHQDSFEIDHDDFRKVLPCEPGTP